MRNRGQWGDGPIDGVWRTAADLRTHNRPWMESHVAVTAMIAL